MNQNLFIFMLGGTSLVNQPRSLKDDGFADIFFLVHSPQPPFLLGKNLVTKLLRFLVTIFAN